MQKLGEVVHLVPGIGVQGIQQGREGIGVLGQWGV